MIGSNRWEVGRTKHQAIVLDWGSEELGMRIWRFGMMNADSYRYRCHWWTRSLRLLETSRITYWTLGHRSTGARRYNMSTFTHPANGTQVAESRGIHLVPYGRLQKYFTSVDLRSLFQDNVALKLSFGATFALTGFAGL